ncbi:MAG: hypothetical protein H0W39_00930 [Sphingomonas sp.]|nr:hypothetical protein [Sphingomonas sp.]
MTVTNARNNRPVVLAGVMLAASFIIGLLLLVPARAQSVLPSPKCRPLEVAVGILSERYKEHIVWQGVVATPAGPRELLLFQSSAKRTWTLLALDGIVACVVAVGMDGTPMGLPT